MTLLTVQTEAYELSKMADHNFVGVRGSTGTSKRQIKERRLSLRIFTTLAVSKYLELFPLK